MEYHPSMTHVPLKKQMSPSHLQWLIELQMLLVTKKHHEFEQIIMNIILRRYFSMRGQAIGPWASGSLYKVVLILKYNVQCFSHTFYRCASKIQEDARRKKMNHDIQRIKL